MVPCAFRTSSCPPRHIPVVPLPHVKDKLSSLRVDVPAWVELLNRGNRRGQLAFIVSVRSTPCKSSPPDTTTTAPAAAEPAAPPLLAFSATYPPTNEPGRTRSFASVFNGNNASAPGRTDGGPVSPSTRRGSSVSCSPASSPSKQPQAAVPTAAAAAAAAVPVTSSWTCLRLSRELSGVVQTFRECVDTYLREGGEWQGRTKPALLRHMGTADQVKGYRSRREEESSLADILIIVC